MHNDDLYDDIIGLAELELGVASNNSAEANGKYFLIVISKLALKKIGIATYNLLLI